MLIYRRSISCDTLCLLLLIIFVNILILKATSSSSSSFTNDYDFNVGRQVEEYIMTSGIIDGIKRSNVCGDGYRIEGALLKSYLKDGTYLPYEDCYMTFQARRSNHQIRIRILILDLNDIHGGSNCFDSLRFYKSAHIKLKDKLNFIECGQLTEIENVNFVSSTGIVTVHFNTDAGNVAGRGFKVVLTAFRYPNRTHTCDPNNDEFLCSNGECISSSLLCDGVAHCLDRSDEISNPLCISDVEKTENNQTSQSESRALISKHQQWRGIIILAFLLLILIVFIFFITCLLCQRCCRQSIPPNENDKKRYSTIVQSPINRDPTAGIMNKRLNDDHNFIC